MTGSPILVQRRVADEVRTRLAGLLENVRVGDGMDPETDMGPLIDKADVARVDGMVQAALAYAKPIVRGGPRPRVPSPPERSTGRPCSRSTTSTPRSSRRKSLARSRPSKSSTPRPTRSRAPTPPNTASRPTSSPATSTPAAGSAARSRPEPSGPTPGRRSTTASPRAATSRAASAGCAAPSPSPSSRKPRPSSTPSRCPRPNPALTRKENDVPASPIEVVGQWMQNLLDPDVVYSVVAPDATYVLLNTEDAELNKIMPWPAPHTAPRRSSAISVRCSPAGKTRRST